MEMERTMFAEFINREKLGMGLYFILALVMIIGASSLSSRVIALRARLAQRPVLGQAARRGFAYCG